MNPPTGTSGASKGGGPIKKVAPSTNASFKAPAKTAAASTSGCDSTNATTNESPKKTGARSASASMARNNSVLGAPLVVEQTFPLPPSKKPVALKRAAAPGSTKPTVSVPRVVDQTSPGSLKKTSTLPNASSRVSKTATASPGSTRITAKPNQILSREVVAESALETPKSPTLPSLDDLIAEFSPKTVAGSRQNSSSPSKQPITTGHETTGGKPHTDTRKQPVATKIPSNVSVSKSRDEPEIKEINLRPRGAYAVTLNEETDRFIKSGEDLNVIVRSETAIDEARENSKVPEEFRSIRFFKTGKVIRYQRDGKQDPDCAQGFRFVPLVGEEKWKKQVATGVPALHGRVERIKLVQDSEYDMRAPANDDTLMADAPDATVEGTAV